ncbi:MAG: BamA/TamA family outer membrane protein, partial [Verrucomicrobiae bacterium]|nr:BamA/TamA family outer membrane protein [Verrucomicrobiae bacterium]
MPNSRKSVRWVVSLLLLSVAFAWGQESSRAVMRVKGTGFFRDRLLMQQLETLFKESKSYYDAADIEDAALIVLSEVQSEGYLKATATSELTSTDGTVSSVDWNTDLDVFLSTETTAVQVKFQIHPGPRFYYHTLESNAMGAMDFKDIESFFYSEPYFFSNESSKVFTPTLLNSSVLNLQSHLKSLGYQTARVRAEITNMDTETGATDVKVQLDPGPLYVLRNVSYTSDAEAVYKADFTTHIGKPYSTFVRQDIIQDIRNHYYAQGYAEVTFEHQITSLPANDHEVEISLQITVHSGQQFKLADIQFEGAENIKKSLLTDQLTLTSGNYLDPAQLDRSRLNLSRLGLFQQVDFELIDRDESSKDLKFILKERTTWQVDTMVGWGSYENLRLGVTAEKLNAFGLGHRLQFKGVVSNKSFLGESRYLVPNIFKSNLPFSTRLFYLEREELSFDREEFGLKLGTSTYLKRLDLTMDAVYTFEDLNAKLNSRSGDEINPDNVRSGSVELRFSRDKRDNPLNPQSGYRLFGFFDWATEALGGDVDYQRAEIGFSYHDEIKRGLIWHGSLNHAVVGSFYRSQSQVPTNKLLYPGGENSIRGYERGGAAPFNSEGEFVGAKSYLLLNLELEQRFTNSLSLVGFFDGLGMTSD